MFESEDRRTPALRVPLLANVVTTIATPSFDVLPIETLQCGPHVADNCQANLLPAGSPLESGQSSGKLRSGRSGDGINEVQQQRDCTDRVCAT